MVLNKPDNSGSLSKPHPCRRIATLQAGTTYSLKSSAPVGTSYSFLALRENPGWSDGSHFVEGYAEYNDGSGWIGGWPIWGSTSHEGDLMFFFTQAG